MKAISFNPQKVWPDLKEWNAPEPGENEVLIKVKAAALNHRDLNITSPVNKIEFIYGSDGAGVIVGMGSNVEGWKIGDEVIINSMVSCLTCKHCLKGEHSRCENGRLIGGSVWNGTFAEMVKVPVRNLERKPEHLSFEEAAALPLAFGTAWRALVTQANLKPGERVFIHGIGGGVALFALQIALELGAEVFVSSGSTLKLEEALKLGAKGGVNYKEQDVEQEALKLSNGEGFNVIIGSKGQSIADSLKIASIGGRIIQFAYLGEPLTSFDVDTIMDKELKLIGSSMHTYPEFKEALQFINQKKLKPILSHIYSLEKFDEGFNQMKNSDQFGKIVFSLDGYN